MKQPILLNIRVPFTSRHLVFTKDKLIEGHDDKLLERYAIALASELKANSEEFKDFQITAIRIDGGSGSILYGSDMDRLLRYLRLAYDVAENVPISMETCPADINGANMPFYNRSGISRFDLELYSLEPQDVKYLEILNYKEQLPYISKGFLHADKKNSMGIIILYGKKTVSKYGFRRSVLQTIRHDFCHVIFKKYEGDDCLLDADANAQIKMASELLKNAGFIEYLPNCWAKNNAEDKFLINKANGANVLGIGLGAITYLDGIESMNTDDIDLYINNSDNYRLITKSVIRKQN